MSDGKTKRPVVIKKPTSKPRTKLTPTDEEKVKVLLSRRVQLSEDMKTMKAELEHVNQEMLDIVKTLDGADETWEGTDTRGQEHRVKVVRGFRTSYDEEELYDQLGDSMWDNVTERVLNIKALEEYVVDGEVDADMVNTAKIHSENKPYIKVTTL